MVAVTSPRRLSILVVVCTAATAVLTWQVVGWGSLATFDVWAAKQARLLRPNRDLFEVTVMFGLRGIILTVCLPYLAWRSWKERTWVALGGFALVLLFETGLVGALKVAVGRSFPYQGPMMLQADLLAYPSGHAGNVVALWGFVAWYSSRGNPRLRLLLAGATAAVTVIVGVSSWLIRTHWPSDLFAGYLLGGIALATVVAFLNAVEVSRAATPARVPADRP